MLFKENIIVFLQFSTYSRHTELSKRAYKLSCFKMHCRSLKPEKHSIISSPQNFTQAC